MLSKQGIQEISRAALEQIILGGEYLEAVQIGKWSIVYNLASIGDEIDAEIHAIHMGGGYRHEKNVKICILATCITRIGSYGISELDFEKRVEEIRGLGEPAINLLWSHYLAFKAAQKNQFEEFVNGKKKVSSQQEHSDIGGDTTENQEQSPQNGAESPTEDQNSATNTDTGMHL